MNIPDAIQAAMNEHDFDETEAKEAFAFVAKCADAAADHLEKHEPYAKSAIATHRKIEQDFNDFEYFIDMNFS